MLGHVEEALRECITMHKQMALSSDLGLLL